MKLSKDHPEYIEAFAYVKRSKHREELIKVLGDDCKIPKEIVKDMDIRFSTLSRVLSELKSKEIIECINDHERTGRIYQLTEKGHIIHDKLK